VKTPFAMIPVSLLDSSICEESSDVFKVWISLLLMVKGDGVVPMTNLHGFARRIAMTGEAVSAALQRLSEPDPKSSTPDYEGRRIEKIDGGIVILNYHKHHAPIDLAEKREKERVRKAQYRSERNKSENSSNVPPVPRDKGTKRDKTGMSHDVPQMSHVPPYVYVDSYLNPLKPESAPAHGASATPPPPPPVDHGSPQPEVIPPPKPAAAVIPFSAPNPEITALVDLVVLAAPDAQLRSLRAEDITSADRVPVIAAAKREAKAAEISLPAALDGLRKVIENQVANLPPEELRFLGTIETYFRKSKYRIEPKHLTGGSNGKSKDDRTIDAVRTVIAQRRSKHDAGQNGAGAGSNPYLREAELIRRKLL